jgi:hypothetical protein
MHGNIALITVVMFFFCVARLSLCSCARGAYSTNTVLSDARRCEMHWQLTAGRYLVSLRLDNPLLGPILSHIYLGLQWSSSGGLEYQLTRCPELSYTPRLVFWYVSFDFRDSISKVRANSPGANTNTIHLSAALPLCQSVPAHSVRASLIMCTLADCFPRGYDTYGCALK